MHAFRTVSRISRPLRLVLLSGACLALWHSAADARPLAPMKPSVEVNLDALEALRYNPAPSVPAINYAPAPIYAAPQAAPFSPAQPSPSQRMVPVEQPAVPGSSAYRTTPMPVAKPAPKPAPKPVAAPVPAPKPVAPIPLTPMPAAAAAPIQIPPTPAPMPVIPTPGVAPTPAPAVTTAPAISLPPPPMPANVAPAPAPIPANVAPMSAPAPLPPLALPSTGALEMPSMPKTPATIPSMPVPPVMEPVERAPAPLPASVEKRVEQMYTPPKEQGIVRDETVVKGPSTRMLEELKKERQLREGKMALPGSDPAVKVSMDKDAQLEAAKKRMADEEAKRQKAIADGKKLKAEQDAARKQAIADAAKQKAEDDAKLATAKKQLEAEQKTAAAAKKKAEAETAKALSVAPAKKEIPLLQPGSSVTLPPTGAAKTAVPPPVALPAPPAESHTLKMPAPGPTELPSLTAITGNDTNAMENDNVDSNDLPSPGTAPASALPTLPKLDTQDDGIPVVKRELPDVEPATVKKVTPPPAPAPLVKKETPKPVPKPVVEAKKPEPKPAPVKTAPAKVATLPPIPKTEAKPAVHVTAPAPVLPPTPVTPPKEKITMPAELPPTPPPLPPIGGAALGDLPLPPVSSPLAAPAVAPKVETPPPAPTPKPEAPKTAVANTPPPLTPVAIPALRSESSVGESRSFTFNKDKTDVNDDMAAQLTDIADKVKKSQSSVRIVAYASGTAEQASVARRISLSRALAIRADLVKKGVNALSINVQALGNQKNEDTAQVIIK